MRYCRDMEHIDWPLIIGGLKAAGVTQPQIAEHCDCAQSTVSDLLTGKTKDPRGIVTLKLLQLAAANGVENPVWPAAGA